jgi:membrane-bound inhibitor of C-type lysozyme
MNLKIALGILIGLIVGMGGYYVATHYALSPISAKGADTNALIASSTASAAQAATPAAEKQVADVTYACDAAKKIHAVYFADKVIIELSDGRAMQLPQTVSADGAHYSNKDGSLVFWSKGPTAFFQELGKTTYDKCVQLDAAAGDTTNVEGAGAN